jgi:hypothetical protein
MSRLVANGQTARQSDGGRRRAERRAGTVSLAVMLVALAGVSMVYAAPVHTHRAYWIGKSISQAEKEFGKPTFSEQLIETGGMMVIYASRKDPVHFVFETAADGRIIRAARIE